MALVANTCLQLHLKNFVRLYCDICHISPHSKKELITIGFCLAILILKMEENTHFWHIMLYYFKKGKNATKTHAQKFV